MIRSNHDPFQSWLDGHDPFRSVVIITSVAILDQGNTQAPLIVGSRPFMDIPLGPPSLGDAPPSKVKTGGQKRKQKNSLPAVFLVKDQQTRAICCGILVVNVVSVGDAGTLRAIIGGVCFFTRFDPDYER